MTDLAPIPDDEPDHPAPFSAAVLAEISSIVEDETALQGRRLRVLDPFAGVGRIHRLAPLADTFAAELQPRWAGAGGPRSLAANARALPFPGRTFDVIATSPSYGNRLSDTYTGGGDRCRACSGTGLADEPEASMDCPACDGTGLKPSTRYGYTISHGSPLHEDNAGRMHWRKGRGGDRYRALHAAAWREAYRVLRPGSTETPERGGIALVNVSDFFATVGPKHDRRQEIQQVVEWHLDTLLRLGLQIVEVRRIRTPRLRNGRNHEARVEAEHLLVLRRPDLPPNPTQGALLDV